MRPIAFVIDEDELVMKMLFKALSLLGYSTFCAQKISNAPQDITPDAVVLDPFISGGNWLEQVPTAKKLFPRACIVVLAGRIPNGAEPLSDGHFKRLGADVVLRKPVQIEKLKEALTGICTIENNHFSQGF